MFLIYITLLLFKSYLRCEAAPTTNASMISNMLTNIANNCENQFLSTQIKSKIEDCDVLMSPYHEKQFECLLFYDINKQLCDAIHAHAAKLDISTDYTTSFLKPQDVSQLCNSAKDWTFTDMGDTYKKTVTLVFHDPAKCAQLCSEDVLSNNSTYYCKYFKWGLEILKTHDKVASASTIAAKSQAADVTANTVKIEKPIVNNKMPELGSDTENTVPITTKINMNDTNTSISSVKALQNNELPGTAVQSTSIKAAELARSTNQTEKSTLNSMKGVIDIHHELDVGPQLNNVPSAQEIPKNTDEKNKALEAINMSKNVVDVAKKSDTLEPKKDVGNGLLNQLENPKPKINGDTDDYQINDIDSEEVRDGLSDTQGDDDGDDPLTDLETKVNQEIHKKPTKNNEVPIFNGDISQKEIYPNTIPEAFGDGDDHFFSFFLTAIIMVVLLYVLYHNKSKVTKVVLGLIVEGRQSGRRRNSRGHAYRRLDTLEQAMSANTAAPPSKIIY